MWWPWPLLIFVEYLCSGGIKLREYIATLGAESIGQSERRDIIGMRGS